MRFLPFRGSVKIKIPDTIFCPLPSFHPQNHGEAGFTETCGHWMGGKRRRMGRQLNSQIAAKCVNKQGSTGQVSECASLHSQSCIELYFSP